jgi:penicillin amidase
MQRTNLILATILAVILSIALALGGLVWYNATRYLPMVNGLAYHSGLTAPVEIVRDSDGVPHIYASTVDDLFFAQGYVHAQDRWWQMDFQRHLGQGRIEELTGYNHSALSSDLLIRTWGWNRAAAGDTAAISPESQVALRAYTQGVNAYTGGKDGGALALEYTLLGLTGVSIEIEPWEPLHSLAWAKVMAWNLSGNASSEQQRLTLYEELGAGMTDAYAPPYPFAEHPTILTGDDLPLTDTSLQAPTSGSGADVDYTALTVAHSSAGGSAAYDLLPLQHTGIGSNNWVIAGEHTASGAPLLANDPHLGIQMPSIWYEVGLHCRPVTADCPYDVVGFSFVGVPAVVVGHNQRIAWGVTNLGPDSQDLYMLRVNPDNPYQYEYNGGWRDMDVITEVIAAGSAFQTADDPATERCEGISNLPLDDHGDVVIEVRLTHFGPIITDNTIEDCTFIPRPDGDPMALRWTALEPGDLFRAVLGLNRAANWADFRQALAYWDWPSQNVVYADVDGNIGYQAPGKIPIRAANHSGLIPVPGWTDEYEWQGYHAFDDLPRILNPDRGWIVTANNAVAPAAVSASISREWDTGYRAQRITEMVSATSAHTVETIAEIQGDNHNPFAEDVIPYLLEIDLADEALADAVTWLAGWDLQNHMDSPQAALFEVFWAHLVDALYNDQIPGSESNGPRWATRLLLDQPDHAWWDDTRTPGITETRDTILTQALQSALDDLTATLGANRSAWRWGDLHTATFTHVPLGQSGIGPVEALFNAGPVATSGGSSIVNATGWSVRAPGTVRGPYTVRGLPSFRLIVDLGDFAASRSMNTTGQSGHPLSPHYSDLIDPWRSIRYHPLHFTDDAVNRAAVSRLELRPGPSLAVHDD